MQRARASEASWANPEPGHQDGTVGPDVVSRAWWHGTVSVGATDAKLTEMDDAHMHVPVHEE